MDNRNLIQIVVPSRSDPVISTAYLCDSYFCKLRGLTFRRSLPDERGLLLVESNDSRLNTTIHMWGVFFSIGVVWINQGLSVVDKTLAKPWGIYTPKEPASYVLEDSPQILGRINLGERIQIIHDVST
jgi:uncharacterized membrane protein (UPF0127 family)